MTMTQAEFDDFAGRMDDAYTDLIAAEAARDALSGGVEAAQAAMDAAVNAALVAARDLDVLAIEFKSRFSDAQDVTPYVVIAAPVEESTDVAVDAPITVTFSKTMDPATLTTSTIYVLDGVTHVPATLDIDAANLVVTIIPDDPLDAETDYKIHVTTGVEDSDGNAMASAFEQTLAWTTVAA